MTITSSDNFGHGNTPVSMSELRTYFGGTNPISLNGSFNGGLGSVPDTLPASGAETSFSDFRGQSRILRKKGTTQTVTSGTSWTPSQTGCVQYNVYVVGGGGSGGNASADTGQEKVANGGAAGGTAFRRYTDFTDGITSAAIVIGTGGASITRVSNGLGAQAGYNGDTTSFNPDGDGATISASGGTRGFGGRQGLSTTIATNTTPVGEASTSITEIHWGQCARSTGGTGSGGENNYTGGYSSGCNVGGDGTQVNNGGSVNLGAGGSFNDGGTPSKPSEWGSDVSAIFRGGTSLTTIDRTLIGQDGGSYGAGGKGSARLDGGDATFYTKAGAGGAGAIFVTYYELNS